MFKPSPTYWAIELMSLLVTFIWRKPEIFLNNLKVSFSEGNTVSASGGFFRRTSIRRERRRNICLLPNMLDLLEKYVRKAEPIFGTDLRESAASSSLFILQIKPS